MHYLSKFGGNIKNPNHNNMKIKQKTVKEICYSDLDLSITEFLKSKGYSDKNFDKYGYECIAENEWGNYQSHSFDVEPELPDEEDQRDVTWLGTGGILNWMCFDGILEKGEYLINVCW